MEKKNAHGLDFWDLEPLVKYYNARGDYDRSKKLCRDIITNLSNSDSAEFALPMSKVYLASAFAAQGEYVEAKKLLNEAGPQIELRRGNFPVYFAEYEKLNKLCSQNK
jgi:ATP/maltotriose-dependent transcriptional regulator MalT